MKTTMTKATTKTTTIKLNGLKPLTLVLSLAFGLNAVSTIAEESANATNMNPTTDTYNNASWQTPLAAEFTGLDTSGNGLLLPNEASKNKTFNKKTFAKADVDHDGYIDQNEYIYFKTGAWPAVTPVNAAANAASPDAQLTESAQAMTEPTSNIAAAEQQASTGETSVGEKRTVGKVIDDTIITAKAKAEILGAKELKSLQISVETRDGEVILSGFVDNAAAKIKAEEVVSKIEGVKSIKNSLEVRS